MPRQARLDAPGVLQHVMARGIERRKIFWDDKDRTSFLERLALILEETQTQCYAWTLIPNHFHLLLRTSLSASADASRCRAGQTPLSTVMRRLMTGYAVTFNIRHRRSGHLFQNRYKSVVCEEDPYLLELIRYIHLNPLRAGLVEDLNALDKYPWTGHSTILGRCKNPLIPETQANESFSAGRRIAFSQFRPGIEKATTNPEDPVDPVKNKPLAEKTDQRILGSGGFVGAVLQESERLLEKKYKPKQSIDDLIAVVAGKVGVSPELICSRSRQRKHSEARAIFSYLAVEETGYPAADVARFLGVKRMSVHEAVTRGKTLCAEHTLLGQKRE